MKDVKPPRKSVLVQYLRNNERILNVLQDLMEMEIPENADIGFMQIKIAINPLTITHLCVTINEDVYIVIEDSSVVDDPQLQLYSELCEAYLQGLEDDGFDWESVTPVVLSTTGLISVSPDRIEPYMPAIDLLDDDEDFDDEYDFDLEDYDEEDGEYEDDGDDDELEPFVPRVVCSADSLPDSDEDEEDDEDIDYSNLSSDQAAALFTEEMLRANYPDMTDEEIEDAMTPRTGVFIAYGDYDFYIFSVYTCMHSDKATSFALEVSEDLRQFAEARMIMENDILGLSHQEGTIPFDAYMKKDSKDDTFRNFLKQPQFIGHFRQEVLLSHYTIGQRKAAVCNYARDMHLFARGTTETW